MRADGDDRDVGGDAEVGGDLGSSGPHDRPGVAQRRQDRPREAEPARRASLDHSPVVTSSSPVVEALVRSAPTSPVSQ